MTRAEDFYEMHTGNLLIVLCSFYHYLFLSLLENVSLSWEGKNLNVYVMIVIIRAIIILLALVTLCG